jgi:hypothetical protein
VQKADRDRLDALLEQSPDCLLGVGRGERALHPAGRVEPLVDRDPQMTRHQYRRLLPGHVVETRHAQRADLQNVAEALSCDQAGPGALALQDGIGRHGRAVPDLRDLGRSEPAGPQDLAEAGHDRTRIIVDRGRDLLGLERAVGAQHDDVGERAADVDADPNRAHELRSCVRYGSRATCGSGPVPRLARCAARSVRVVARSTVQDARSIATP